MKFDIGICAYNEGKTIGKLLKSLLIENYKNELGKIYVVCSGCSDNTEDTVKKYSKRSSNITLIHEDGTKVELIKNAELRYDLLK